MSLLSILENVCSKRNDCGGNNNGQSHLRVQEEVGRLQLLTSFLAFLAPSLWRLTLLTSQAVSSPHISNSGGSCLRIGL